VELQSLNGISYTLTINLINIKSKKVIHGASLRDQCQKDYLYGNDGIFEKNLSEMEGAFHQIIDSLVSTETIGRDFETRYHIIELLALQKSRTLQAEEELNRMADQLSKLMMYNKLDREVLEKVEVGIRDAAALSVVEMLKYCPIMYDLKHFLVINRTATPFIISDNPVLHTNWFCRSRLPKHSGVGIAKSGLQIFMPIAPYHALLLHDKYVYESDSKNQVVLLRSQREVDSINEVQWLNAYKNIYFPSSFSSTQVEQCLSWPREESNLSKVERLNATGQAGVYIQTKKTVLDAPDEGVFKELVHFRAPSSPKDIRVSSIRIRSKPIYFDDGSIASPHRDLVWPKIVQEFVKRVESERLPFDKLWESASSHPLFSQVGPEIRKIERSLRVVVR